MLEIIEKNKKAELRTARRINVPFKQTTDTLKGFTLQEILISAKKCARWL